MNRLILSILFGIFFCLGASQGYCDEPTDLKQLLSGEQGIISSGSQFEFTEGKDALLSPSELREKHQQRKKLYNTVLNKGIEQLIRLREATISEVQRKKIDEYLNKRKALKKTIEKEQRIYDRILDKHEQHLDEYNSYIGEQYEKWWTK